MLLSYWHFTGEFLMEVVLDHFVTDFPKVDHFGQMEVYY